MWQNFKILVRKREKYDKRANILNLTISITAPNILNFLYSLPFSLLIQASQQYLVISFTLHLELLLPKHSFKAKGLSISSSHHLFLKINLFCLAIEKLLVTVLLLVAIFPLFYICITKENYHSPWLYRKIFYKFYILN